MTFLNDNIQISNLLDKPALIAVSGNKMQYVYYSYMRQNVFVCTHFHMQYNLLDESSSYCSCSSSSVS